MNPLIPAGWGLEAFTDGELKRVREHAVEQLADPETPEDDKVRLESRLAAVKEVQADRKRMRAAFNPGWPGPSSDQLKGDDRMPQRGGF